MSSIQFDEGNEINFKARRHAIRHSESLISNFLLNNKIVKDKKQASHVLLGMLVFIIALTLGLIYAQTERIPDTIIGPDGTSYTPKEYVELVGQGRDPFQRTENEN